MRLDMADFGKHLLSPRMSHSATVEIRDTPVSTGDGALALWHFLQYLLLALSFVLVALLLFVPEIGIDILWNILIPAAPLLVVVAPGLWRNVCPMATLSLLPQHLGLSRRGMLSHRMTALLGMWSLVALFIIVPYRHLCLDTNGPMSALLLVSAGLIAFCMGVLFKWRSGWCTTLCPIHPVERLYGIAPMQTFRNARCTHCERCAAPCPDSTRSMTPAITGPSRLAAITGHVLIGGFVGFIWGWYQVPDYSGIIGLPHYMHTYLWPFGGALVSLTVYTVLYRWFIPAKKTRRVLIRVFATAAVSTYYWYRIPALVGLGPFYGTGLLYDLTPILPAWSEHLSHVVTTAFFFWFMLIRNNPGTAWMVRPTLAKADQ